MLNPAFLTDPFAFKPFFERQHGCASLTDFLRRRYLGGAPAPRAISLLSGNGVQDLIFLADGLCEQIHGAEESPEVLAEARAVTAGKAVTYVGPGLGALASADPAPLVYSMGRLAYASDLAGALDLASQLTEANGLFFYLGYVGPRSGPEQGEIELISRMIAAVPQPLLATPFTPDEAFIRAALQEMGPPHAGELIQDEIRARFRDVQVFPVGGLMTYALWRCTLGKLTGADDAQVALKLMIQVMEQRLIGYRLLNPVVKLVVARK